MEALRWLMDDLALWWWQLMLYRNSEDMQLMLHWNYLYPLSYDIPFSIAVTVSLTWLRNPHTIVSTDKVQTKLLLVSMSFTAQVTDTLRVELGHTPQPSALTLYCIYEQTDCTGSHWKVSAFLVTWARWTLSGGGAALSVNDSKMNAILCVPLWRTYRLNFLCKQ